jgi:type III secretory pathway component EscS
MECTPTGLVVSSVGITTAQHIVMCVLGAPNHLFGMVIGLLVNVFQCMEQAVTLSCNTELHLCVACLPMCAHINTPDSTRPAMPSDGQKQGIERRTPRPRYL